MGTCLSVGHPTHAKEGAGMCMHFSDQCILANSDLHVLPLEISPRLSKIEHEIKKLLESLSILRFMDRTFI